MIKITRLTECTFNQALTVWNEGFQGYFADMTFTMDRLIGRFGLEGLSPEMSLVAWNDGRPVGFILNGWRTVRGHLIAWNGGTGVVPEFRRSGVGRLLMEACLEVYQSHGVHIAHLEAIAQNTAAISLYEQFGYRIVDKVAVLSRTGSLSNDAFLADVRQSADTAHQVELTRRTNATQPADCTFGTVVASHRDSTGNAGHTLKRGLPHDVAHLPFYQAHGTWQTQWQSVLGGQSIILEDEQGNPVAYAIYKRGVNEAGDVTSITLYQCGTALDIESQDTAVRALLREIFSPFDLDCRRAAVNLPLSSHVIIEALQAEGFTTSAEQVVMKLDIGE